MQPFQPFSLNIRGRLTEYRRPAVMGIINVTPDSFYAGSRRSCAEEVAEAAQRMVEQGADIIDVGGCSTRFGQQAPATEQQELERLRMALPVIREITTDIPVSVDTFRASVARVAVEELGADIINDISLCADPAMAATVASLRTPYIMMHTRGDVATMASLTAYPEGVTAGVIAEMAPVLRRLRQAGVADIIVDPGLGFAKTAGQCYELLADTPVLAEALGCPVLIGLSRKSMLWRPLGITAADALEATVSADTAALMLGASVLRVHDVAPARQSVQIVEMLRNAHHTQS